MKRDEYFFEGFADSHPSESIQKHTAPGLAVSVVFPYKQGRETLVPPVKQYKETKGRSKARKARELAEWLSKERELGLTLAGFILIDTWEVAAQFGLRMISELKGVSVKKHYESYRIYFDGDSLDFPQAVALMYYYLAMHFGCLRFGTKLPVQYRNLMLYMDRFPGAEAGFALPGVKSQMTPGMKFLKYFDTKSITGKSLFSENQSIDLNLRFGNLEWWRKSEYLNYRKGKCHPNFKLPDWLNQAAMAANHKDEFIASYDKPNRGREIAEALGILYDEFRKFDFRSLSPATLNYIQPNGRNFKIPSEAVDFIMNRALEKP